MKLIKVPVDCCLAHTFYFASFNLCVLNSFEPVAEEVLSQVCERYVSHAHTYIYLPHFKC